MYDFLAVVQLLATIAIAFFAYKTSQVTRLYSKIAGLQTAAVSVREIARQSEVPRLAKAILKILMKDFPEELKVLESYLPRSKVKKCLWKGTRRRLRALQQPEGDFDDGMPVIMKLL